MRAERKIHFKSLQHS